jgi:hypothetical protein
MIHQLRTDFEQLLTLVTGPEAHTATLDQMERSLFRQVLRLGLKLLQLFLATRVAAESHAPQVGPDQTRVPYHSQKPLDYFSIFGKLTFARAYFYTPGQAGVCPLDAALSLPARCYSDLLLESAEVLSVDGAYDKSLEVLSRLLGLRVPKRAVETSVAEHSALVDAFYAPPAPVPVDEEGAILVVQADGKGVPMVCSETADLRTGPPRPRAGDMGKVRRGKGDKKTRKKEAIAIAVYTIAPYPRPPQDVVNALFKKDPPKEGRPTPCHKRIFASLKGKPANLQLLADWATQRDGPAIQQRVALTDGAEALQDQLQAKLSHFTLVLDFIHVDEYLWKAGTALYGETDPNRAVWVETQLLDLLSSRTKHVIQRLEDKAKTLGPRSQARRVLQQVAGYLRRNQAHMDYATYLKRGWPIGTGVIEGVCRHLIKDRLELSGMRWTKAGADALLALRAVNENHDWDAYHQFRRAQRHEDRYGVPLDESWLDLAERLEIN